jgi:hypothetical protein
VTPSAVLSLAVAPCAACAHAENHHLGCRLHDGCCGADDCHCMGFQPERATRAEIERIAAFAGIDPDVLEAEVRRLEAEAAGP